MNNFLKINVQFCALMILLAIMILLVYLVDCGVITIKLNLKRYKYKEDVKRDATNIKPTEEDKDKRDWMKRTITLLYELNVTKCFMEYTEDEYKNVIKYSDKVLFSEMELMIGQYFRLMEYSNTAYLCNHVRLLMFNGKDKMKVKDFGQIYAIILLLSNI